MTSSAASSSGISSLEVACCDDVNRGQLPEEDHDCGA
jgi:hypothetical protein